MTNTPQNTPTPKLIEIVAFPDMQVLDVTGPLQVFQSANRWEQAAGRSAPYVTRVVSRSPSPVRSWAGLSLVTEPLPPTDQPLDTLIVSGGDGVRAAVADEKLLEWLRGRARTARRVASVCTGAFLLAACGLLDGRRAATHWEAGATLAELHPAVDVDVDPIYIEDGSVWTSAGVTSGIDMSLALVERDLGHAAAMGVARSLVVFLKRPGGQAQFSAFLELQTGDVRFDALHGWIADNLSADLSVGALADRVGMSERSFVRHFARLIGATPARAVERLRVEAARELLSTTPLPVKRIAQRCGFGTEETMRRSFLRQIAVAPQDYRRRFQATGESHGRPA